MRYYELMYISDPSTEDGAESVKRKIESIVSDHEGSITSFDKLGKKRLAYPILKRQYGIYNLVNIQGKPSIVAALETFLRLNSKIFRHIILVFTEKTLKLRTETQRIQVEEDERMRRGGRPVHGLSAEEKKKISSQKINPSSSPAVAKPPVSEKVVEEVVVSEPIEDSISSDGSNKTPATENDEKVVTASEEPASKGDDTSDKETVEE